MQEIKTVLLERLGIIQGIYLDYKNNPYEADLVHDLRVSIREIRGLLNFIKPVIGQEKYDEVNTPLRDAAQVFGLVRELDVLTELCAQVALDQPGLSDHYYELFHFLDVERRQEMRRTFNKTNVELIEEALANAQSFIESLSNEDYEMNWDKFIAKRLNKKNQKLQKSYDAVDLTDYATVHTIRKAAKKNRYAATYYKDTTSIKTKSYRKSAENIQEEFGEITDAHVNYALLTNLAGEVENADLKTLLLEISDIVEASMEE